MDFMKACAVLIILVSLFEACKYRESVKCFILFLKNFVCQQHRRSNATFVRTNPTTHRSAWTQLKPASPTRTFARPKSDGVINLIFLGVDRQLINCFRFNALLGLWCTEAVLRFQELRDKEEVSVDPIEVHALLHAHLVRGLVMLGVLPRRSVQLLRDCELTDFPWKFMNIHCFLVVFRAAEHRWSPPWWLCYQLTP